MDETQIRDDVETVGIEKILPYGENPKEHPEEQVDKIASSIRRFGWDQPIVVDGAGEIIKGHGRYQAARRLGLEEIPILRAEDLSDAEVRAARIADNRVAESSWDIDLLGVELELLEETGEVDPELTGFDEDELEAFMPEDAVGEEPDPREEWDEAGITDFDNEDDLAEYTVKVNFEDTEAIREFAQLVEQTVTPDTDSIWFPPQPERRQTREKGWVNEADRPGGQDQDQEQDGGPPEDPETPIETDPRR